MYKVIVTEQKPLTSSIFCSIKLEDEGKNTLSFGSVMYFTCDFKKRVIQYPRWLDSEQNFKQQIINLGYKF